MGRDTRISKEQRRSTSRDPHAPRRQAGPIEAYRRWISRATDREVRDAVFSGRHRGSVDPAARPSFTLAPRRPSALSTALPAGAALAARRDPSKTERLESIIDLGARARRGDLEARAVLRDALKTRYVTNGELSAAFRKADRAIYKLSEAFRIAALDGSGPWESKHFWSRADVKPLSDRRDAIMEALSHHPGRIEVHQALTERGWVKRRRRIGKRELEHYERLESEFFTPGKGRAGKGRA